MCNTLYKRGRLLTIDCDALKEIESSLVFYLVDGIDFTSLSVNLELGPCDLFVKITAPKVILVFFNESSLRLNGPSFLRKLLKILDPLLTGRYPSGKEKIE